MKIKKASNFVFFLLRCIFKPLLFFKCGFRFNYKTSKKIKRPCLIVSNHVSFHDQFIIGVGFKFAVNFVGSDSLFRANFGSKVMQLLARPIPIRKGASDPSTVKAIMKVVRDGGAVAMFPEGNRSFFGETSSFRPTIGKLTKKLEVPLVIVKIRGGFSTSPRWREKVAKGKMDAFVQRVIEPSEAATLSGDEINDIIAKELYFNEFEYNKKEQIRFKGKTRAEHLESLLFSCANCGAISSLHSKGNDFWCDKCNAKVTMNEYGFFDNHQNADNVPSTMLEYSRMQIDNIKKIDLSKFVDKPFLSDEGVTLFNCERAKNQEVIGKGAIALYGDRIEIAGRTINIEDITDMAMQSVTKYQIYLKDGTTLMVLSKNKKQNVFKYMVCIYRIKNINSGDESEYYGY